MAAMQKKFDAEAAARKREEERALAKCRGPR
jgi:hypothetical protein